MKNIDKKDRKVLIFKIIVVLIVLAILVVSAIYLFPLIRRISTPEGQVQFKEEIQNAGFLGFIMLFFLNIAQMILAFIPGGPIEIMSGMCYGAIGGTLFILFSSFVGSLLIFFSIRKFGHDIVYSFCNKEQIDKIENSEIFQNPDKVAKIMYILFLIPGTPKDFLTYIIGLIPIKNPIRFLLVCTLIRTPTIVSSTIAGSSLINGAWWISILAYVITFALVVTGIVIFKMFSKNTDVAKAVKEIK